MRLFSSFQEIDPLKQDHFLSRFYGITFHVSRSPFSVTVSSTFLEKLWFLLFGGRDYKFGNNKSSFYIRLCKGHIKSDSSQAVSPEICTSALRYLRQSQSIDLVC
jgi:hypothetical protein